jgi:hypothetical protein
VASLRFSPETLRGIRNFGADLASPSARAGGMLTGAPQQSLPNIFARNVGTLLGRDMRTPGERLAAELASIPENDPRRLEKQIALQLQTAVQAGDRPTAARLTGLLQDIRNRREDAQGISTPKAALSSAEIYKDENGNQYQVTPTQDATGKVGVEVTPIGDAPEYTNQKLIKTGGQFNLTAEEDTERLIKKEFGVAESKAWSTVKLDVLKKASESENLVSSLERALEIAESNDFESGGFSRIKENFKEFVGMGDPTAAEFQRIAADNLLDALGNFTGAISNSEREFLEQNLSSLSRSKEVNVRLLKRLIEKVGLVSEYGQEIVRRSKIGRPFKSFEEYYAYTLTNPLNLEDLTEDDVENNTKSLSVEDAVNLLNQPPQ